MRAYMLAAVAWVASAQRMSCQRSDMVFTRWPLDGESGRDYFIMNYVDLDRDANEKQDFTGTSGGVARTYDGHKGIDVVIANFRRMDNGDAVIRAAAPGRVTNVQSNNEDRNSVWCPNLSGPEPRWNVVEVTHANGWRVRYGHLKRYSATVNINDNVVAGQILGVVGSSGCSTDPHLHFEVIDCNNMAVETFSPSMWSTSPPAYSPPSNIMDVMLKNGMFADGNELRDPPAADVERMPVNSVLGIGIVSVAIAGDTLNIKVYSPRGLHFNADATMDSIRKELRRKSWSTSINDVAGQWRVEVRMNTVLKTVKYFNVGNSAPTPKTNEPVSVPKTNAPVTVPKTNAPVTVPKTNAPVPPADTQCPTSRIGEWGGCLFNPNCCATGLACYKQNPWWARCLSVCNYAPECVKISS